jgi:hypothetical protein
VALLALWCSFALSSGLEVRGPDVSRYVFPGAALALPAIAISLSGLRLPDRRLLAVFGVAALCLVVNIFQLRSAGEYLRGHSISTRAGFGAVQLAAAHIDPSFVPSGGALAGPLIGFASRAERYLPAAARIGPIGYPPAELETIDEPYREEADQVLAEAFRLNLQPAELPTVRNRQAIPCERIGPGASIQLPKAGAVIRVKQGTSISLGRFADKATATLGRIPAGASRALTIPTDRSERPWFAGFDPQSCVEVVPLSVPLSGSSN